MKKKLFFMIALILSGFAINNTYAYKASEAINLYVTDQLTWGSIYIVPTGKDLIVSKIIAFDIAGTHSISLRDNGGPTLINVNGKIVEYNEIFVRISDNLEVIQTNTGDDYSLMGFLVDEDEDIQNYINGEPDFWNKNIFIKEDLDLIYLYEFIFFTIISVLVFFERVILRRKLHIKLF